MSVNKPNFPLTGQGDRRTEDAQKELLSRLPKQTHITAAAAPLPLNISHSAAAYQVTKTLTRQIAPAPGGQILGGIKPVAAHQVTSLNPAVHKKVTEIQKVPLSLTSTAVVTTIQPASISNIIPVQISASSATPSTSNALHVPNVSSIVRGALPGGIHHPSFSHIPRGVVAASAQVRTGSTINIQRQTLPTSIQTGPLAGLPGQIRNVIPQMIRPGTPPTNRSASPAVSLGNTPSVDAHRATNISLHNSTTTTGASSIHITLQPSRAQADTVGKPVSTFQAGKVHVNQATAINMTSQPKVVMTHSLTPLLQHQALVAKGRGQPIGNTPMSTVTVAPSVATVTIPIMTSGSTTAAIPIAKVPPQRHHQVQSHVIPSSVTIATSHAEHRGTEPTSFPTPQPAHAHTTPVSQIQAHTNPPQTQPGVTQAAGGVYIQQYRNSPVVTTVSTNSVSHAETRASTMPIPFPMPYMLSPENPYYQQLLRCQVAAVAQPHARPAPPTLPTLRETTATLAASLQAVSQSQSMGSNVRLHNPLMVMQDSVRPSAPHTSAPTVSGQLQGITVEAKTSIPSSSAAPPLSSALQHISHSNTIGAVAAVASSLFTAATQNLHVPQIGQPAPNTPSATPINNPNSSPRPSILRKRTNEGVSAVKKQLAMTSEVHSPRFETRPDSTPQSNMSSPKTPASGMLKSDHNLCGPRESPFSESQSSTDTALSSEATTPTQPHSDIKVKHEHDIQENGYTNNTPEASPRKRRKQLLQATEELKDTPVNVFDKLVEACVKQEVLEEEEELDDFDDDEPMSDTERHEIREEYVDDEGIRWTLEKCRPGVALLNFYNISWKPRNNHFNRYTDVKPKDERRPTVNELSNQKGVVQKASGWKLYHMAAQIEDLVELERELYTKLTNLQTAVGPEPPLRHSMLEDESGKIHELTQGNIQRCKLLTDQLNEAKSQMLKVLDHKPKISEIVTRHLSKRPIKKKERT